MVKPNFFIIGSVKCGTTTLFSYLQKSPEVFMPYQKEPHYFLREVSDLKYSGPSDDNFFIQYPETLLEYENLFDSAKSEKAIGEASTMYLQYPDVASKIYKYNSNAKIIVLIRNPIERAFSHYLHHIRENTVVAKSFDEAIEEEINGIRSDWAPQRKFIETGKYYRFLKSYFDVFPKDQILVLKFENFVKNPNYYLSIVSEFLGIKDIFQDEQISKHNASGVPKSATVHNIYLGTLKLLRKFFPFLAHTPLSVYRKKLDNIYRNRFLKKPQMHPETRIKLRESYKDEINNVAKLTAMDLSDWK